MQLVVERHLHLLPHLLVTAGNNIFVYYLASQVGTVGHPSNQALSATNGTFSGNTTVAGTSTFTGDVTVGDGSAADKKILFDGNAQTTT